MILLLLISSYSMAATHPWARDDSPALKEDHKLIRHGPYALVRHPIYTGTPATNTAL